MTPARHLRFVFDYESPNAYIAWVELPRLEQAYRLSVETVPVLYAGLLDAHGHVGPGEIRAKAGWMARDLLRKSGRLGIPLNPPAFMPFNPLLALRVTLSVEDGPSRRRLIQALFEAVWVRRMHVSELAAVGRILDELELPRAELLEAAQTVEVKEALRAQTAAVAARGVFGVPTMEIGGEIFWGYDDFGHLEAYLAGEDPLDRARLAEWGRRPASSNRKAYRS